MSYLPKDYVGVSDRVEKFHEKYPNGQITTDFTINEKIVYFKASVILDVENPRVFTGSSFGNLTKEKAFEKLETVAVGRALAFAGFETQSGIASKEEMEVFNHNQEQEDDDKEWFNEENFEKFKAIKDNYNDGKTAVKEARKKYKVSRKFAEQIENLYS